MLRVNRKYVQSQIEDLVTRKIEAMPTYFKQLKKRGVDLAPLACDLAVAHLRRNLTFATHESSCGMRELIDYSMLHSEVLEFLHDIGAAKMERVSVRRCGARNCPITSYIDVFHINLVPNKPSCR